jgi:hypothetical protein
LRFDEEQQKFPGKDSFGSLNGRYAYSLKTRLPGSTRIIALLGFKVFSKFFPLLSSKPHFFLYI